MLSLFTHKLKREILSFLLYFLVVAVFFKYVLSRPAVCFRMESIQCINKRY